MLLQNPTGSRTWISELHKYKYFNTVGKPHNHVGDLVGATSARGKPASQSAVDAAPTGSKAPGGDPSPYLCYASALNSKRPALIGLYITAFLFFCLCYLVYNTCSFNLTGGSGFLYMYVFRLVHTGYPLQMVALMLNDSGI